MKKKIISLCLVIALALTAIGGATLAYFTDKDEVQNTFTVGKVDITLDEAKVDDNGEALTGEKADRVHENTYTPNMVPGHGFDKDPTIHVEKGSEESYIFLDVSVKPYKSLFWLMAADASADTTTTGLETFTIFNEDGTLKDAFKNASNVFGTTKFIQYMAANKTIYQAMIGKWIKGIKHTDWTLCDMFWNDNDDYLTIRFAYKGDKDGNECTVKPTATADTDIKFMDTFEMPASVTQKMIEDGKSVGKMQNTFGGQLHLNFTAYAIQADGLDTLANAYQAMFNQAMGTNLSSYTTP